MTVYTVWEIKPSGDISIEILDGEYLGKDVSALDVDNELFSLSLIGVVKTHEKASWKLYFDIYATNEILSKTVYLDIGDNIFYILITAEDGNIKLNTIIIRRLPIYTVSFNTQGGSYISPQYIQEKDFVKDPNSPTKTGYTFDKWDFNFDSPILGDITINALWTSNKYQINYDISDELMEQTQIVMYDNQYELITPKREDFIFIVVYNNILFTNGIWDHLNDITLTPKWSLENTYQVKRTYIMA